ncbi:MAG: acetolactate synthase [Proteobacteria bacterium]|nr:acetolactate synthase [Pseudomonadota bacterium]MBI3499098.1 acetolactate synthase [Pseudomonadota bacterium]
MNEEASPPGRRAADLLVASLAAHGVRRVFCVPGESYLAVLDALADCAEIEVVSARHEGGAGFMAVADAKLTFMPAVLMVSRGPGATNAAIAVHTAQQDAVPLVVFVGQVERKDLGRRAFQEVDYAKTFADMAKGVRQVMEGERLGEAVAWAFHLAGAGTPGPVLVVLPEDMLLDMSPEPTARPRPPARARASEAELDEAARRIAAAERPLVVAGGPLARPEARSAVLALAERWQLPVAAAFKQQDLFPNEHPNFAGHLGYMIPEDQVAAFGEADLILAVGTRLGDVTSQGYRLPTAPTPLQPLIHVYPDPEQLGRVYDTALALAVDPENFVERLALRKAPPPPNARSRWIDRLHAMHADRARWTPVEAGDGVSFGHVVAALARHLPPDAILITDAGNFSGWLHRHFPFSGHQRLLGVISGAMGFGTPAAVAASLRFPHRNVVALIGDGGFLMTGNELATAMRQGAKPILFVSNNASYGTIRMHQERHFPGRKIATDLVNPDFAALARAYGATGLAIAKTGETDAIVQAALAAKGPVVVDVKASLEHISAFATLSDLAKRAAASRAK